MEIWIDNRLTDVMPLEGLIPSNLSLYDDDTILIGGFNLFK